jgi:organic radical activating enzyme
MLRMQQKGNLELLTEKEMNSLLNEIIRQYNIYFLEAYGDHYPFDAITGDFDAAQYDYNEVMRILTNYVNNMINYCDSKRTQAPNFRSPTTEMTFGDILTNVTIIRTVNIQRIRSMVYIGNMSRNLNQLINRYEYDIYRMTMEMNASLKNAEISKELADTYQKNTLMTFDSMRDSISFSALSEVYDRLLLESLTQSKRANELYEEINFYNERLSALRAQNRNTNIEDVLFIENEIETIVSSLLSWATVINQTVYDYLTLDALKDITQILVPVHYTDTLALYYRRMAMLAVGATCAGLFLSVLMVLWAEAFPHKKRR